MLTAGNRIKNIPDDLNICKISTSRIMPDAILRAFKKPSRKGLFWFEPKEGILDFSTDAKTHYDSNGFTIVKNTKGWIRGMVFEKDKNLFILVYKVDFMKGVVFTGKILKKIYQEITEKHNFKLQDIVDEEGYSLLLSQ